MPLCSDADLSPCRSPDTELLSSACRLLDLELLSSELRDLSSRRRRSPSRSSAPLSSPRSSSSSDISGSRQTPRSRSSARLLMTFLQVHHQLQSSVAPITKKVYSATISQSMASWSEPSWARSSLISVPFKVILPRPKAPSSISFLDFSSSTAGLPIPRYSFNSRTRWTGKCLVPKSATWKRPGKKATSQSALASLH